MFFWHISCATATQLCLKCVSTILDNRATVHLVAEMKIIFSFPLRLETVHRTLATKRSDGATTSDQWRFALSWPVATQYERGIRMSWDMHRCSDFKGETGYFGEHFTDFVVLEIVEKDGYFVNNLHEHPRTMCKTTCTPHS